jgi:hypothetical protein
MAVRRLDAENRKWRADTPPPSRIHHGKYGMVDGRQSARHVDKVGIEGAMVEVLSSKQTITLLSSYRKLGHALIDAGS